MCFVLVLWYILLISQRYGQETSGARQNQTAGEHESKHFK